MRDWVHGFAANVLRPAGSEWDEREETPWPIIQEAAKIGLYGFEGFAQFWADPTGLTMPIVNEELFWGDAGIGQSIMATALAVASIFGSGTPEQVGEWIPQCFGTADDVKVASFCVSEPDAGSDVSALRTTARYDEAIRRVGPQRPEGVGDQRRHRGRPRRRRERRPRARLARPGGVHHRPRHARPDPGHEGQEARHPRLAHRRRVPRRRPHPGPAAARRQGEARRAAGPRPRGHALEVAGGDADVRSDAPDRRRAGDRHRPGRVRIRPRLRQASASSSAARSSRTRRSRSRSPT